MSAEGISFEDYANFSSSDATLPLPEKDQPSYETDINHGAFTSVIEIDDGKKVAKINRLLRFDPKEGEGAVKENAFEDVDRLVTSRGDRKSELNEAVANMREFAREKMDVYESLAEYIPDNLPKLHMFAVVDSPRRVLESSLQKSKPGGGLTPEQRDKIPSHEIALMEIWDNIDPSTSLRARKYEGLSQLKHDESFKSEMANFSTGLLKLLKERGIIVDVCDRNGIRGFDSAGQHKDVQGVDAAVDLLQSDDPPLVYPRNVSFKDGKLSFFDTYPVIEVSRFNEDPNFLDDVIQAVASEDYPRLKELSEGDGLSDVDRNDRIIEYVALLKKMGADLKQALNNQ